MAIAAALELFVDLSQRIGRASLRLGAYISCPDTSLTRTPLVLACPRSRARPRLTRLRSRTRLQLRLARLCIDGACRASMLPAAACGVGLMMTRAAALRLTSGASATAPDDRVVRGRRRAQQGTSLLTAPTVSSRQMTADRQPGASPRVETELTLPQVAAAPSHVPAAQRVRSVGVDVQPCVDPRSVPH